MIDLIMLVTYLGMLGDVEFIRLCVSAVPQGGTAGHMPKVDDRGPA